MHIDQRVRSQPAGTVRRRRRWAVGRLLVLVRRFRYRNGMRGVTLAPYGRRSLGVSHKGIAGRFLSIQFLQSGRQVSGMSFRRRRIRV